MIDFGLAKAYVVDAFLRTAHQPDANMHLKLVDLARECWARPATAEDASNRFYTIRDGAHPGARGFRQS